MRTLQINTLRGVPRWRCVLNADSIPRQCRIPRRTCWLHWGGRTGVHSDSGTLRPQVRAQRHGHSCNAVLRSQCLDCGQSEECQLALLRFLGFQLFELPPQFAKAVRVAPMRSFGWRVVGREPQAEGLNSVQFWIASRDRDEVIPVPRLTSAFEEIANGLNDVRALLFACECFLLPEHSVDALNSQSHKRPRICTGRKGSIAVGIQDASWAGQCDSPRCVHLPQSGLNHFDCSWLLPRHSSCDCPPLVR